MSRLCRLRNASHGDDGQWAYSEIVGLREQLAAIAEQNEAIIAAANALENIASTSSSTRIRRVANEALTAIRARRNHG